ncbi:cytochrome P450 monooxygenase [Cordyceps fumosorosea ARSEF 2679]|uniref:Cytochrome P450 monooxygenase n=1 Tax=Cordyceps fumosorosea (strain ARSEF 2679) TaxID=1081104 RepID=A0A168CPJ6_CORFA|nr:cytochrome P450 monooxygenase [Cordyceps fumosorosea ARSEF 2679]OAA71633.1 cytochrome P450 monooxygenase [Cordyceps fumosorosea ARSEF 2679]
MSLHIASLIPATAASSLLPSAAACQTLILTLLIAIAALFALREWLLPRALPGIPHNAVATRSLLGDVMAIQREMPDNISEWVVRQGARHASPVYQVFLVPFGRPFVVVSDFREAQDILVRRAHEFDRSDLAIALLRGEMPSFHACLKTGPLWSARRRLLQDLMSPAFLHGVAAPNMYAGACRLLELWRVKRRIAGTGRPFAAALDLSYATLDALYEFGYGDGTDERALAEQLKLLGSLSEEAQNAIRGSAAPTEPVDFPRAPLAPAMDAMLRTMENIPTVAVTGFPDIVWRVLAWFPRVRRLRALKDQFIRDQVDKAVDRLSKAGEEGEDDDMGGYSKLKCALDLILLRERALAKKENRTPVYWSKTLKDEMFGFVTGGHETSANVLAWGVKFLADHPAHQSALRARLRAAHPAAVAEGRFPTHAEITTRHVPFLLACTEEILRCAHATSMTDRQATADTVVLGHPIPRGTTVVLVNKGPGYTEPNLPIDESRRSASAQKALAERPDAGCYRMRSDERDMGEFNPRRWLVPGPEDGDGEEFDAAAYPTIPFGLGPRGCFGRRMVYVQFRQLLTLLVWQFELLPCPKALSGYDAVQVLTNKPRRCYVALKEL